MKYFIIAGERSGDLHASNLIKELKRKDYEAEVVGFGGDMMEEQGVRIIRHYKYFSFMGIWEVLKNLGTIRRRLKECKAEISQFEPDVLILVDFPGFNLRMAKFAKNVGIQTCYYISPKIWAWKKGRIKSIRKHVDKMLVILPFEVAFYKKLQYEVEYVGNPLMDAIRTYDYQPIEETTTVQIAVLPGSRMQELRSSAPVIKEMARLKPEYNFLLAGVNNLPKRMYEQFSEFPNIKVVFDRTYDILKVCNAAMVTSGTATLEACLLSAPQVVVYRTSWLTYTIGKAIVNIDFISLVNLIAGKEVIRELIQKDFNALSVLVEIDRLINDSEYCGSMMANYQEIKEEIGFEPASKRAANAITTWQKLDN